MPPYGAKMGPEGGSTKASATEALLLPGPRLKIEGDHAPIWRQDGSRRGPGSFCVPFGGCAYLKNTFLLLKMLLEASKTAKMAVWGAQPSRQRSEP